MLRLDGVAPRPEEVTALLEVARSVAPLPVGGVASADAGSTELALPWCD